MKNQNQDLDTAQGYETRVDGVHGNHGAEEGDADDLEEPSSAEDLEEEEEDGSSDTNEEEDRRQYGIHQCLPVDDQEPDFDSGEPTTAEEYLRRVR
jgi:hypothetical protein